MPRNRNFGRTAACQRGFSIVELSIAVLIALFLLGGLVTLLMGTRRTNATQGSLEQLQDNERIAMTLITNVVQQAGYFPDPVNQQLSSFPAETVPSGLTLAAGQVLAGTYNAAAPGDTLIARYYTPSSDPYNSVINCAGQSNPAASSSPVSTLWYTNIFQIGTVNNTKWLQCQVQASGTATVLVNLIPNVTQIKVLYGVSSATAGDDYSVIQYLNAGQMTATNWLNVTAVKVTLSFLVPSYGATGGQMSTTTQTFQRVIPIMSRSGVNT